MSFGTIMAGTTGAIVLAPDGNIPKTSENLALKSSNNPISTATFEVSDNLGSNPNTIRIYTEYTITLPSMDVTLLGPDGKSTMRVGNFTSNPATNENGTLINGISLLSVGATLFIEDSNPEIGLYASTAPFPVTVNFN